MSRPRILIVEDDDNLALVLADNLDESGYDPQRVATSAAARDAVQGDAPDLVILDVMLPDDDGYTTCEALRGAGYRGMVLMLTARTLEEDIVRGFAAGADDYVTKPYRLAVLLARVAALVRRGQPAMEADLRFDRFVIDEGAHEVREANGAAVDLTRTAYDLLVYFVKNAGRALTRDEILDAVWGEGVHVDTRTVDNFVSTLKKKLHWSAHSAFRIRTIRGVGYRFERR